MTLSDFDALVIEWNNTWPLDRWYRQKYNIPFNSPQHQEINQIDVYFEWREEKVYLDYEKKRKVKDAQDKLYKQGLWLNKTADTATIGMDDEMQTQDWFDKIDITQIVTPPVEVKQENG